MVHHIGILVGASPSSRRAWIEIRMAITAHEPRLVALLAEGVDRNCPLPRDALAAFVSPSSRRAWIEIFPQPTTSRAASVALLAEGVDRNFRVRDEANVVSGRPPRGGRG